MQQPEIDNLINSLKRLLLDTTLINIPDFNNKELIEAKSHSDFFYIDLNKQGRRLKRYTLQLRAKRKKELPLLRLDLVGPDHPNPPGNFPFAGEKIPCPHIHIAKEGYGDKIAYPLNSKTAGLYLTEEELEDFIQVTQKFLDKCNVVNLNTYSFNTQQEQFNI